MVSLLCFLTWFILDVGADVLVVAPTGMGKVRRGRSSVSDILNFSNMQSLCFQIPAIADKVNFHLLNK